jgi:hypothetical protein
MQGIVAATAAVISFSASGAQEGRTLSAKINVGSNDDPRRSRRGISSAWADARHQASTRAARAVGLIGE